MLLPFFLAALALTALCAGARAEPPDEPFAPPGMRTWDLWFAREGGTYHAFYLQQPDLSGKPVGYPQVGHAVSTDLRNWTERGPVLVPLGDTWNDVRIATGSVVRHENKWWMVFSGGGSKVSGVGLAVSDDLAKWTKVGEGPVVPFGKDFDGVWKGRPVRWYPIADPYILPEPIDGWYYMAVNAIVRGDEATGAGCIGCLRSRDLKTWEAHAVMAYPGWFERMETPQMWSRDGRWYLYIGGAHDIGLPPERFVREAEALTGRKVRMSPHFRGNFLLSSARMEGPYEPDSTSWLDIPGYIYKVLPGPEGDVLLTSQGGRFSPPYPVTYRATGAPLIGKP